MFNQHEDIFIRIARYQDKEYYVISAIQNKYMGSHLMVSSMLQIGYVEYIETLKTQYNAIEKENHDSIFVNREDAQRALDEYVIPRFVMIKLSRG